MLRKINDFSYDETNGLVVKKVEEHQLTKIQRKLFNYFIKNPKITISKQTLMDEVWKRTVTENSIEKTLSKLRNVIEEDPLNPRILITHHGHGVSFEGNIKEEIVPSDETDTMSGSSYKLKYSLPLLAIVILLLFWFFNPKVSQSPAQFDFNSVKGRHLMVLPIVFDESTDNPESNGVYELLKSTFNNLDNKGKIVFDESGNNPKEVMERHWKIDQDLILMQTSVEKNGEIYDAVVEITSGMKSIKRVNIRGNSLTDLANKQIKFVEGYTRDNSNESQKDLVNYQVRPIHLQISSLMKNKNYTEAKQLLNSYLKNNDTDFYARFLLSRALFELIEYKKSLIQLKVVQQSGFYQNNSASVEILVADNRAALGEYSVVIDELTTYLSQHLTISPLSKAKIEIQLASAHNFLGNLKQALKFYKQAILNLDEKYNPKIYALSYFGQARIANVTSNDEGVYKLFEKSLHYAKLNKNIQYQATIMDALSALLFFNNQWEKGLKIKRESIALMEIVDDKSSGLATGLGVLASYLIERGLFTEARTVVDRIDVIAKAFESDHLSLIKSHYDVSIEMLLYNFDYCQTELDKNLALATKSNNSAMLLNAVFLQMELLLARKNTFDFKLKYDQYIDLFNQPGLDRYQIYMDFYLARYYKEIGEREKSMALLGKVSELAKQSQDLKFLTDAQNVLAQLYLETDSKKALDVLNAIEQYNPNPNPYLEIKAKALHALDRNVEAMTLMLEAKSAYNEAWSAENQEFLEKLQKGLG